MAIKAAFRLAVQSLHFQRDRRDVLRQIGIEQWPALLRLTDRSQITLALGVRCGDFLPDSVRERIDSNLADNRARHQRLFDEYQLIAEGLHAGGVDFVLLKGLAQIAPYYLSDACQRPQYDIDLFCPSECHQRALEKLREIGYRPVHPHRASTDHAPAMIRDCSWTWTGDYYSPDLPLSVEIHFRFWDPQTERMPAVETEKFWSRRTKYAVQGAEIPMLCLSDGVSYSALHLIRHLLRGDLRVYHVYELAHFLNYTADDHDLWQEWLKHRSGRAPVLEAVAFRLASEWFGCKVHSIVDQAVEALPTAIKRWFELFAYSPLITEQPNKDELFLHLSLVDSAFDQLRILTRRLAPFPIPQAIASPAAARTRPVIAIAAGIFRHVAWSLRRVIHHFRTAAALIPSFLRWKMANRKYATS